MSGNSLTKFAFCKNQNLPILLILLRQKDILTLDGLEKGQLIQLDDVTRIKMALRNKGQLTPCACYLEGKIGNFAVDFTEIISAKKILSNCSKHLVSPVN